VIGLGTLPEAEEAAPPPAPKPRARVAASNGAPPQRDLFEAGAAPRAAKPPDKRALKRLLAELMELRAVMTGEPR
jgi:hypothetical protein